MGNAVESLQGINDAVNNLPGIPILDWFFQQYGPGPTLALVAFVLLTTVGFKVWQHVREGRAANVALDEKEKAIQRLAEENRLYRIMLFKDKVGWTDDEIERFMGPLPNDARKGRKQ